MTTPREGDEIEDPPSPPTRSRGETQPRIGHGMARTIRVALVDDHHVVREGLRLVLAGAAEFEVVGDAANAAAALGLVAATAPDVLVLDLTLAGDDGIQLLREVRARHPMTRVVVLTMHRDAEIVRRALASGADGYVVKGAESREVFEAIRAVSRGERYLHSSVTGAIVDDSIRWLKTGSGLSPREREILSLVAAGHYPAEVARMLQISVHTVRRHIANLSDKLGIHGTSALTRYAIQNGLTGQD